MDHLWHRIQHKDEHGGGLKEVCMEISNPFVHAAKSVASMLLPLQEDHSLWTMFWHFAADDSSEGHLKLLGLVRRTILCMSAQLWWMFLIEQSQSWRILLARMVDSRLGLADQRDLAQKLWDAPACCKDNDFEGKVMGMFESWQQMMMDDCFLRTLRTYAEQKRLSNMHLERALASVRRTTPSNHADIERITCAGGLAAWLQHHVSHGGADPNCASRQALLREGVPLEAQAKIKRKRVDAHFAFINQEYQRIVSALPYQPDKNECKRIRKVAARAWHGASPDQIAESKRMADRQKLALLDDLDTKATSRMRTPTCWGLAVDEFPIDPDKLEHEILQASGATGMRPRSPAYRVWSEKMRDFMQQSLFVKESGEIVRQRLNILL